MSIEDRLDAIEARQFIAGLHDPPCAYVCSLMLRREDDTVPLADCDCWLVSGA